jgi:hypothetical protein
MRLPRWPPENWSSRPALTCSNPDVGRYEVKHPFLTRPSLYSEFPPGLALFEMRSGERYSFAFYGNIPRGRHSRPTVKQEQGLSAD